MRKAPLITLCIALAVAIAPATAMASPATALDGDFAGGTNAGTHVFGGDVYINETIFENQDFAAGTLPATWSVTPWPTAGGVSFANGVMVVDGALAGTNVVGPFNAPQSLRVRATFSADPFENVGLGTDFTGAPWATFSTGDGTPAVPTGLYARTLVGTTADNAPIAGVDPTVPHDYEIRWTPSQVTFFVDGRLVSTQNTSVPDGLRILVSDYNAGAGPVSVDGVRLQNFAAAGTFTSRVLDVSPRILAWGALNASGSLAGASFETRSGTTPAPDASWSGWQGLGAGGAILSPVRRYVQYRANLSSLGGVYGARVDTVGIGYDQDTTPPTAAISRVLVKGATARVAFSSRDADVALFECSLDGDDFKACTSPKAYSGFRLGTHRFAVRAIDHGGNVGAIASRAFRILSRDGTAPRVALSPSAVRLSRHGKVAFRVTCPRTEERCRVTLQLRRAHTAVSSKRTVTVRGGTRAKLTLKIRRTTRRYLSRHGRLRVTAVTVARDAAGNRRSRSATVTLRAPKKP